jgi:hypothetical protein
LTGSQVELSREMQEQTAKREVALKTENRLRARARKISQEVNLPVPEGRNLTEESIARRERIREFLAEPE